MTATRSLFFLLDGWDEVPPFVHLDPEVRLAEIRKLLGQGEEEEADKLVQSEIATVRPVYRVQALGGIESVHNLSGGPEGFDVSRYMATLHFLESQILGQASDEAGAQRHIHLSTLACQGFWPAKEAALLGMAKESSSESVAEFANVCLESESEDGVHLLRVALRLKKEGHHDSAREVVQTLLRSSRCLAEQAASRVEGSFLANPDAPVPTREELQSRLQAMAQTMNSGDYERCIEHSMFYLSWVPDDAARWFVVAILQQQFGRPVASRTARITSEPPSVLFPLAKGQANISEAGALRVAERCFKYAIQLGLLNHELLHQLANTKLLLGAYEDAVKYNYMAARLAPEEAGVVCDLGLALMFNHELDKAELVLRRAMQLRDDLPLVHMNLARLLSRTGREKEAEPFHERAKKLFEAQSQ